MKLLAAPLLLSLLAATLNAQRTSRIQVEGVLSSIDRVAREAGTSRRSDGLAYGGGFTLRSGAFSIGGSYLEATLEEEGSASRLPYVEGSATAMFHLTPWLAVGPGVRAFRVDDAAPERWVYWGLQTRVDLPLIGPVVRGHATFTEGLSGSANIPEEGIAARNGEVGLTLALPQHPFELGVATRVETTEGGGRTRTLQHFEIRLRWVGP
jgi:hypothetical protein